MSLQGTHNSRKHPSVTSSARFYMDLSVVPVDTL